MTDSHGAAPQLLEEPGLDALLDALRRRGYRVIGPVVRDGAIALHEVASVEELPRDRTEIREPGNSRLARRGDGKLFGYTVGAQSWKRFLFPPEARLWWARRDGTGFALFEETRRDPPYAFIGVRPCELHAIAIQDRVFLEGPHVDASYEHLRRGLFVLSVNCGDPAETCFCASMNTGPRAEDGFDLSLTELVVEGAHRFLCEIGSELGAELLGGVARRAATDGEVTAARGVTERASRRMGRSLDTANLDRLLPENPDDPRWNEVARRCLSCANCTMVCPTCFCSSVEDRTDLAGDRTERWRRWDSCFTGDFSYIHGGRIRHTGMSRYRQWLTHKLATWVDQFGRFGCVGCGRCITWCPVGIDITEEARALRDARSAAAAGPIAGERGMEP